MLVKQSFLFLKKDAQLKGIFQMNQFFLQQGDYS
jgi:hypothetical protein